MKQFLFFIITACVVATACKKSAGGSTRLVVYNATHSIAGLSAAWNGNGITANPLAQAQFSGSATAPYVSLPAGTNNVLVRTTSKVFFDKNAYTAAGNAYTLLVYDTSKTDSSLNILLLTDNLTLPDTASAKCRIINCVADTTTLRAVLLNKKDTLAFPATGSSFIGRAPATSTVQAFASVKKGTYRFLMVENYTGLIVYTAPDSIALTAQSIHSLLYSGLKTGVGAAGIKFNAITHPVN